MVRLLRLPLLAALLLALSWVNGPVWARQTPPAHAAEQAIGTIRRSALPPQAQHTLDLIARGGPFPYEKDGTTFGNYERLLPSKPRGYYREYTVPTPGAHNRGARRIVCGGPKRHPEVCYYTHDHYASFRRIVD